MLAKLTQQAPSGRVAAFQVFLVASFLGLIAAGQHNLTMRVTGGDPTLWHALVMGLPYWYLWALSVPLVAYLARLYPVRRAAWVKPALLQLGFALVITLVLSLLEMSVQQAFGMRHNSLGSLTIFSVSRAFWYLPSNLLAYGAILGVVIAVDNGSRARRSELAAATMGAELAESRLHALRTQLNPHFLFNAMNSIAMLVRKKENATAVTMIAGLSDLMRSFLDERPRQEVPLREELAFVERYLAVEQLRFPDRLKVSVVVDPGALDAYVPNLVLQPVVENAIKHGIARSASAGQLVIKAESRPETLVLTVSDDGPGPETVRQGSNGSGVGLRNIRERLLQLYGPGERFQLSRGPGGGALATITLPYRTSPA